MGSPLVPNGGIMQNLVIPAVVLIDPLNPNPGATISVTVIGSSVAQADQLIDISGSPSGFFSSLPNQATIASGNDRVTFAATVSTSGSGAGTIVASANGAQASGSCLVS